MEFSIVGDSVMPGSDTPLFEDSGSGATGYHPFESPDFGVFPGIGGNAGVFFQFLLISKKFACQFLWLDSFVLPKKHANFF